MAHATKKIKAVCFGEVLWDVFPTHKKIGGAPLNVASRLQALGAKVDLISSIGTDAAGEELLGYLESQGVGTATIQKNPEYATGQVLVTLTEKGNARYDIHYPSAWDKITYTSSFAKIVSKANVFVYGSLGARDHESHFSLLRYLKKTTALKVFDANLRPPYYTFELLLQLMHLADFIKLNDEELREISTQMGSPYASFEQNISFIAQKTHTSQICVTKGPFGAVLFRNGKFYYNSGYFISVVDTVGAGDSFLASLLYQLLKGKKPQKALNFACAVGALVAASEGANPILNKKMIRDFMRG